MPDLGQHIFVAPLLPPVWTVAVVAALLVAAVVAVWRWPAGLSPGRRAALLALRLLVIGAVAWLIVQPEVRWRSRRNLPAEVAVLLDASRSMGIRDAGPEADVTRAQAVREAVAASAEAFAALAPRAAVRPYAFGSRARPADTLAAEPADPRTDLAEGLRAVAGRSRGVQGPFAPKLAAVVVVSDGCANRRPGDAVAVARDLARRGVPVHTVLAGSPVPTEGTRDVAVRGVRAPDRAFAGNQAEVRATVAALGLAGTTVEVVLSVDGEVADRRRLTPDAPRTVDEIVFAPRLEKPGPARLCLSVEPVEGERVTTNNRAETTVRVEQGGIRALYLQGRLSPEGKYLARTLADAREIDLERRLLVGKAPGPAAPKPADLESVDVLIVGDVPAAALPPETIARVRQRIRTGELGLLMLGGLDAYGPGGWAGAELADVLPFGIEASHGQVKGPLTFRLTKEGARHAVFRGDRGGALPASALDSLPALPGASEVGAVRADGRVLANSAEGAPLLAVRTVGEGRVAAATCDTTWPWALATEKTGGPAMHRRLWRRVVVWLALRDGPPGDDFYVMTDRTQVVLTDRERPPQVLVTVGVRGDEPPGVRVEGPATATVALVRRPGADASQAEYRGMARLREAGTYTVVAEGTVAGEARRAEAPVTVREHDFEFASLLADADRLGQVAQAGGGTACGLEGLPDLLTELAGWVQPQHVPAERRVSLAKGQVFLAVIVALMAAEWLVRRRWGLA